MQRILIGNIKGPQGAQGIQGPQGPVGATGPQGPMPDLVNNALATEAGVAALDAVMGKTLQDQITDLNSKMSGYPNYNNKNAVINESGEINSENLYTYEVTRDGYVQGKVGSQSTIEMFLRITINDFRVYQGHYERNYGYLESPIFPVRAGDMVKVNAVTNSKLILYFFPDEKLK